MISSTRGRRQGVRGVRRTPYRAETEGLGMAKKSWSLEFYQSRDRPLPRLFADGRGYAYPRTPRYRRPGPDVSVSR